MIEQPGLNLDERLRRIGRASRTTSFAFRFNKAEADELKEASLREGKTVREWSREVLLREARRGPHDPVFTELVGLRMILMNFLKPLLKDKVTPEWIAEAHAFVRAQKRNVAGEIRQEYDQPKKEGK